MFPRLDRDEQSRSIRVAMSDRAWRALDRAIATSRALTRPRAIGEVLERALGTAPPADWQEWQIRKEKQLLEKAS